MRNRTNRLVYVDFLRVMCVILLVADHSFAIYSGIWPKIDGIDDIPLYYWIGRFCCSFMLPLWFFISGYLWSYQVVEKKREVTFVELIKNKGKRLLLPCYFFGLLSIICSGDITWLLSGMGLLAFFSGVQHLWFLVVLFWIFLISWFLHRSKINDSIKIAALIALSIIAWNVMSLGIGGALHYLLYFQLGYYTLKYKTAITRILDRKSVVKIITVIFCLLFVPLTNLLIEVTPENVTSVSERTTSQVLMHIVSMPLEILGIALCYSIAIGIKCNEKTSNIIGVLASYSFGIYLFHHFVLTYLYNETTMASYVGSTLLPIMGFVVSIIFSILLTWCFKRFRIGRVLVA